MDLKPLPAVAHAELHTIASHTDTTATGLQLNELVAGGDTVLHTHAGNGVTDHDALNNLAFADAGHTGFQAQGDILDDLNTLGAVAADSQFLVGAAAGVFNWESGATARTSIGLGNVEDTQLSTWAGSTNITTLGTIATVGNITIADGGTIGQAAGPLLTFNDTNDLLSLTGAKFRIGGANTDFNVNSYIAMHRDAAMYLEGAVHSSAAAFTSAGLLFSRARGSYASKDAVVEDDRLFFVVGRGYDGAAFQSPVAITGSVDGAVAGGSVPARLSIDVGSASGSRIARLIVNTTSVTFDVPTYIKEQAAAIADVAAYGQDWVKNTAPCTRWFTDDAGNDFQLNGNFVVRAEQGSFDWTETGSKAVLNTDGNWHDLDCSSIVPAGAIAIQFYVTVDDDWVEGTFRMRKNGFTGWHNNYIVRTQVAGIRTQIAFVCPCDVDRKVEYWGTDMEWTDISVIILGWILG